MSKKSLLLTGFLLLSLQSEAARAQEQKIKGSHSRVTAQDQSNDSRMIEQTRKIRWAITEDRSLSTEAHNIKIITTNDGTVTLMGPVRNAEEKQKIEQLAGNIAGGKVRSELVVRARRQARAMLGREQGNKNQEMNQRGNNAPAQQMR
jgi:hyperosmotically inducible protein